MTAPSRPPWPVVLACAEADDDVLAGVRAALEAQGYPVETLPGVDLDLRPFAKDLARTADGAIYVVCESDDLDPFQIRRLEGLFSANRSPRQFWVHVHLGDPTAEIVEAVDRQAERFDRRPSSPPVPQEPRPAQGRPARTEQPRTVGTPDAPTPEESARDAFRNLVEQASMAEVRQAGGTRDDAKTPTAAPSAEPPVRDASAPRDDGKEVPRAARTTTTRSKRSSRDRRPPEPATSTRPDTTPGGRGGPRLAAAGAVVLLVGIGAVTAWHVLRPGSPAVAAHVRPEPAEPVGPSASPTPAAGHPEAYGEMPARDDRGPAARADDEARPMNEPPPAAAKDGRAADPPRPTDGGPEPKAAPTDSGADETVAAPVDGSRPTTWEAVRAAVLAEPGVKAHRDVVFFVPEGGDTSFRKAANACIGEHAGAVGWRLPTVRTLRRLKGTTRLPPAAYWSRTRTNEIGDELFVLDKARGKVVRYLAEEPSARAVCVLDPKRAALVGPSSSNAPAR
ncbi:MAG: hypothetical protein D6705_06000 [Deltaproteobacteria bacterium]|nr:MAG: hypothetical protein D6705_06000 [Deltaproteobacteria bacterium]